MGAAGGGDGRQRGFGVWGKLGEAGWVAARAVPGNHFRREQPRRAPRPPEEAEPAAREHHYLLRRGRHLQQALQIGLAALAAGGQGWGREERRRVRGRWREPQARGRGRWLGRCRRGRAGCSRHCAPHPTQAGSLERQRNPWLGPQKRAVLTWTPAPSGACAAHTQSLQRPVPPPSSPPRRQVGSVTKPGMGPLRAWLISNGRGRLQDENKLLGAAAGAQKAELESAAPAGHLPL